MLLGLFFFASAVFAASAPFIDFSSESDSSSKLPFYFKRRDSSPSSRSSAFEMRSICSEEARLTASEVDSENDWFIRVPSENSLSTFPAIPADDLAVLDTKREMPLWRSVSDDGKFDFNIYDDDEWFVSDPDAGYETDLDSTYAQLIQDRKDFDEGFSVGFSEGIEHNFQVVLTTIAKFALKIAIYLLIIKALIMYVSYMIEDQ